MDIHDKENEMNNYGDGNHDNEDGIQPSYEY